MPFEHKCKQLLIITNLQHAYMQRRNCTILIPQYREISCNVAFGCLCACCRNFLQTRSRQNKIHSLVNRPTDQPTDQPTNVPLICNIESAFKIPITQQSLSATQHVASCVACEFSLAAPSLPLSAVCQTQSE